MSERTYKAAGGFGGSTEAINALDPTFLSPTMSGEFQWPFIFSVACLSAAPTLIVASPEASCEELEKRVTELTRRVEALESRGGQLHEGGH